jgi:XTP/dITP diphosphohydrolase
VSKKTILIATRNAHKTQEIRAIIGDRFEFMTLQAFPGAPNVTEDAPTFAGNATKKAVELARWLSSTGQGKEVDFVMADDSGLEVDALGGAPGVHSARFAALDTGAPGNSTDSENRTKLIHLLKERPTEKRTARFHCVIALTPVAPHEPENASPVCYADELELQTQLAHGTCEGKITLEPKGTGGFGYDPLFVPDGFTETFAEIGDEAKNRISHRGKALARLRDQLQID